MKDWGWKARFDMESLSNIMIENLFKEFMFDLVLNWYEHKPFF
jgi:hypothetical protein